MKAKILCIEDDPTTQAMIKIALRDYNIIIAPTLTAAEIEISKGGFSALVFDIQLPDGDGISFYSRIKSSQKINNLPVVFLTSYDEISYKLLAFSTGADDFISKPFDPLELNARITSKISKYNRTNEENNIKKIGDIEIDLDRQKVYITTNGSETDLNLTAIEQKILILLSNRAEQVFSREQILNNVWANSHITDRTVDSHIAHLRKKIFNSNMEINTVKNFGYKIINK